MSFDAAKVRRFLVFRKRFREIVCDNSPFVDPSQLNAIISIFLDFRLKLSLISWKISTFAASYTLFI